jgi:dTDP-4-dehydrorhamnose reductase
MRLLVVGGSGLVGAHVMREARARGHFAAGTYRGNPTPGLDPLDGARTGDFEALLDRHAPEVVVHAAGWTWVDGCEGDPDRALEENCRQPARMAELCAARGIRFAYFSTSYVFDGTGGPYDEDAPGSPINAYGRSKWEAERALETVTKGTALIARIICVFGEEDRRKNFAYQVLGALRDGKTLRLPADQTGNPTWAGDIAAALLALLERSASGTWHLAGEDPACGRVQWAERLAAAFESAGVPRHADFRLEPVLTADLRQPAPRPLRGGMVSRRLAEPTLPSTVPPDLYRRMAAS